MATNYKKLTQEETEYKPAYQSQYSQKLNAAADKLMNRKEFNYNVNDDALYQQYKDQYIQGGRQAMQDTMGMAQATTGGYGNSYAQTAGQQTYQRYLQGLNNALPELYNAALQNYIAQGDQLTQQYGMLSDLEAQEYARYMDDLAYQYQLGRDQIADQQWQTSFDEDKRRYDQEWYALHPELAPGYVAPQSGGSSYVVGGYNPPVDLNANPPVEDDVPDTSAYREALRQMQIIQGGGGTNSQVKNYLSALQKEGSITSQQESDLYKIFVNDRANRR